MGQAVTDKRKTTKPTTASSSGQQRIWMRSVDGETFLIVSKEEENQPKITLGRLRGRRQFSSEKQAKLIQDWYETLNLNQSQASPTLNLTEISDLDLIALSKMRLASREMESLAQRLSLSGREIATLLTLSPRTFHRRKPEDLLDQVASERLLMLTKLGDHGFDVFEDQGKFNRWLRRPLRILSNQAPLDILDTSQGIKLVDTILGRIEYGVYS